MAYLIKWPHVEIIVCILVSFIDFDFSSRLPVADIFQTRKRRQVLQGIFCIGSAKNVKVPQNWPIPSK